MHFHLVNVQVVSRQPFNSGAYTGIGSPPFTGPPRGPDANERGWKETVKMYPSECTTVIAKWDLPNMSGYLVNGTTPLTPILSPRTGNHEYVWHCHILEHEEHDMMNTIQVVDARNDLIARLRGNLIEGKLHTAPMLRHRGRPVNGPCPRRFFGESIEPSCRPSPGKTVASRPGWPTPGK